ncbi:MAG: excision repair protein [Cyanobacteriota bacterium erpe_2018_sw_39hr_WHONDRS-SW48-000098_B_bin.30]|nr:excision repair protein [Cyanobacteriota bacterium erpe_2018_sw_39hr_WHONDRS-SW48-000098_B_bin.30]
MVLPYINMQKKASVSISIKDFALPSPLTGSIEINSGYAQIFGGPLALAEDGRGIHSKLQKQRQKLYPAYKAEQRLAHKFESDNFVFAVSGRADGFIDGVRPTIEEIKSTINQNELSAKLKQEPHHPYRLQLATYAYIVHLDRGVVPVTRLLVVGNTEGAIDEFTVDFDPVHYENWLAKRLAELDKQVTSEIKARERRKTLSGQLTFPFESPRPGQKELIEELSSDIVDKSQVLIQAPTGLGKTAAVIFPLLRDALSRGQKLIYVTPKNSQHIGAQDALAHLREVGCRVKSMTLNAKARMCLKDEVICNPGYCEYARDYYDKLAQHKLVEKVGRMNSLTQETFKKIGEKYQVCPFELSLDAISQSDVVVADYNYVFSPRNTLGRFTYSLSKDFQKPNLVIDEAHNLPQRSCDYYSKSLSSAQIVATASDLSGLSAAEQTELRTALSEILFSISNVGRLTKQKDSKISLAPEMFEAALAKLTAVMVKRLAIRDTRNQPSIPGFDQAMQAKSAPPAVADKKGKVVQDPILALFNYVSDFQDCLAYEGDEFLHLYTRERKRDMSYDETLKVVCCDASSRLKLAHKEFAHVAAFSATIKPFQYFAQLSGFEPDELSCREYFSPFPRQNRKILVIPQVSTKYSDRERNYDKIAQAIARLTAVRAGNYFVFFPSFVFLEAVYARVKKMDLPQINLLKQESEISQSRAKEIIEALGVGSPTLVFAVQGGVFAEGVDYPGEMIIGAIIVGPGLPNYNFEREKIREYYEKRYGSGFDYAYIYPAMAKVIQAAGRVIRSDTDKGLIVLMDKRFTEPAYVGSMPLDWTKGGVESLVSQSLVKDITQFWQEHASGDKLPCS